MTTTKQELRMHRIRLPRGQGAAVVDDWLYYYAPYQLLFYVPDSAGAGVMPDDPAEWQAFAEGLRKLPGVLVFDGEATEQLVTALSSVVFIGTHIWGVKSETDKLDERLAAVEAQLKKLQAPNQ